MPTISPADLEAFARRLLRAAGATEAEAARTAAGLASANLRGYDSHGVMRLPYYVAALRKGDVVSGGDWTIEKESANSLVADAEWGFGHVVAGRLLDRLMEKAKQTGVAVGTLKRCGHIGRLGEYAEIAAAAGLISITMVNSHGAVHRVAPPGGRQSRLGTNPICFGAPSPPDDLILDFSTSATAEGKVRVKHIAGEQVPDGWLVDSEGRPTNEPAALYDEPRGSILPFGGPQAYKGFGLSLMVELLTGALSGGLCSREKPETQIGNCVFMQVIDPGCFGGAEAFLQESTGLSRWVRSCPTVDGVNRVLLPGDPERATLARKQAEGVSLDAENWAKLVQLAGELGVDPPA